MIKKRRKQLIQIYMLSDILAIVAAFNFCFWLRFLSGIIKAPKGIPPYHDYLIIIPFLLLAHLVHFSYQGFYKIKLRRNRLDDLFLVVLNTIVTIILVLFIFSYLKSYSFINFEISHIYLLTYGPAAIFFIFGIRLLVFKIFKRVNLKKNGVSQVLVVGDGDLGKTVAENLKKYQHFGIEICGFLAREKKGRDILGSYAELEAVIKKFRITDVFITLSMKDYSLVSKMIETANNLMVDVRLVPDILQIASLNTGIEHLGGVPIINLGETPYQGWGLIFKRGFDFVLSLIGTIFFLPFSILCCIVIKLTSKGPVFYLQERVGLDGKLFKMIKFRTMIKDAEAETGATWALPDDKRITWFGRILRKFSIDELPQILNVLKGDMSLVGPRPERPDFVDQFKNSIPRYMLRHRVKTGITGWAQVHGFRGNTPLDKRIEFDIYYIKNWSLRLDLQILWRTIFKLKFIDRKV